jgi:hypothetical protein
MDPRVLRRLEKIFAAGIELVPDLKITSHYVFTRNGFAALVEKRDGAFGNIGAAGLVDEHGFAALFWRDGEPYFVGRGREAAASAGQVDALRAFERDLREALE